MKERIEHHACPKRVCTLLEAAGGYNLYGEPNFRLVWGYDRIIKLNGRWEEWEPSQPITRIGKDGRLKILMRGGRPVMAPPVCKKSVIEAREVPKYLPGNCWHLEMWRPPEEYGTLEKWKKMGEEVYGSYTLDTAGEFPTQGDWELVMPITHNGTPQGVPIPIEEGGGIVEAILGMLKVSRNFTFAQRKSAIEQRMAREEARSTSRMEAALNDGLPAFSGNDSIVVPHKPALQ